MKNNQQLNLDIILMIFYLIIIIINKIVIYKFLIIIDYLGGKENNIFNLKNT